MQPSLPGDRVIFRAAAGSGMRQSIWYQFIDVFDVQADGSDWSLGYECLISGHKNPTKIPVPKRCRFQPQGKTKFGLMQRSGTVDGLILKKCHGIYIIADEHGPIYVGHARGAENFLSRLGKHRLKLTGSHGGIGILHPKRWRNYAVRRYRARPGIMRNDTLVGFRFSLFVVDNPTLEQVKKLEGRVYRALADAVGPDRLLNDPARIDKTAQLALIVQIPEACSSYRTRAIFCGSPPHNASRRPLAEPA